MADGLEVGVTASTTRLPAATSATAAAPDRSELEAFHDRHRGGSVDDRRRWAILLAIEIFLIVALWEVAVSVLELVRPQFLPPPSAIAASFAELLARPSFPSHLLYSVTNLLIGVALAAVAGITVGLLVGWSRLLELVVAPVLWTVYSVPKVAFAPLVILALGLGPPSKIFLVFLLGFFPIALNTIEGVRTVDPNMIRAARVFGTRGPGLARKVILPATLPFVLVGLRRAVALGFIGAMLGEFLGGSRGIGHLLREAAKEFRMDDALALVVIMIVVANAGLVVIGLAQRRWFPWSR
jgi:ABC-type nitrate/sulfonate/bicarbonate transport system permease component